MPPRAAIKLRACKYYPPDHVVELPLFGPLLRQVSRGDWPPDKARRFPGLLGAAGHALDRAQIAGAGSDRRSIRRCSSTLPWPHRRQKLGAQAYRENSANPRNLPPSRRLPPSRLPNISISFATIPVQPVW